MEKDPERRFQLLVVDDEEGMRSSLKKLLAETYLENRLLKKNLNGLS